LKEDAMKRMIGFALATGLALLVAGCADSSRSTPAGEGTAVAPGAGAPAATRNFNLAVKCPGVHWEKTHGWSDQQIMQQEAMDASEIPACEAWVQAQPKGYVPPPPPGVAPAPGAKAASAAPAAGDAATKPQ
jgi:hypothetical protein